MFYSQALDTVVPVSSTQVAEMVKLLENTFRMINIGLVNEIAIMCDGMGINVWEVIDAAATKPFGFMPFYPGPGLGGHCIPIDPFYLSWKTKQAGIEARFIELAGYINGQMPHFVVNKVQNALNDVGKPLKGSEIHIYGVSYKRDIDDVRESPALRYPAPAAEARRLRFLFGPPRRRNPPRRRLPDARKRGRHEDSRLRRDCDRSFRFRLRDAGGSGESYCGHPERPEEFQLRQDRPPVTPAVDFPRRKRDHSEQEVFHMLTPSRILSAVMLAALTVAVSSAQMVTSAHSGTLHYFDGAVAIDGSPVQQQHARFPEIKENSVLSTTQGRAEVLLTPGVFLRIGENSSVKMWDNRLISTRVEVLSGNAIIESDDPQMDVKNSPVTIVYKDYEIHLQKQGLFEIGAADARMQVYKGEAVVSIIGGDLADRATVREGHQLTFSVALLTEKFNDKEGDDLYLWARDRSQAISAVNMSSASTLNPNGFGSGYGGYGGYGYGGGYGGYGWGSPYGYGSGLGNFSSGWYFNPWLDMYTFMPGAGAYWNAFGYGFFSPSTIYAFYSPSSYWYGGGGARGAGPLGWSLGNISNRSSGRAPLNALQPRSSSGVGTIGPPRGFGGANSFVSSGSAAGFARAASGGSSSGGFASRASSGGSVGHAGGGGGGHR